MFTLLQHPSEFARLRADMNLLPSTIEEVLRFRPPINTWLRCTAKDVELRGQKIPAQQMVLLVSGSANRDEACFAEPDKFDITRNPNPHVSFGNGIHFCVGAPLAVRELSATICACRSDSSMRPALSRISASAASYRAPVFFGSIPILDGLAVKSKVALRPANGILGYILKHSLGCVGSKF